MALLKNFFYNSAIVISTYVIALVIFPYISRTLGVEKIGILAFVDNAINYFVMFIMLGIQSVGIREIAACNNDVKKRTEVFMNLLSLLLVLLLIVGLIYTFCIFFISDFKQYKEFFLIGYIKLMFTPLMLEWLYVGCQDFKFISIRTILIKVLYAISIFLFVKTQDDLIIYFSLTSFSVLLNSMVNIVTARKYLKISSVTFYPGRYLLPVFKLGCFQIIISFYTTFNYVYLGIVNTAEEVGYYYTAIKLYTIIVSLFTAFTGVILPRMSQLAFDKDREQFALVVGKSFNALFTFSIPIIIFSVLYADNIISIIAGEGYVGAVKPMMVIMPVLFIAGLNQINGSQVLLPLRKDNVLLVTSSIAAFFGILSNIILDPLWGALGTALTILCSEFMGMASGYFYSIKKSIFIFPYRNLLKHILCSTPYLLIFYLVSVFKQNVYVSLLIAIPSYLLYFIVLQSMYLNKPLAKSILNNYILNGKRQK